MWSGNRFLGLGNFIQLKAKISQVYELNTIKDKADATGKAYRLRATTLADP